VVVDPSTPTLALVSLKGAPALSCPVSVDFSFPWGAQTLSLAALPADSSVCYVQAALAGAAVDNLPAYDGASMNVTIGADTSALTLRTGRITAGLGGRVREASSTAEVRVSAGVFPADAVITIAPEGFDDGWGSALVRQGYASLGAGRDITASPAVGFTSATLSLPFDAALIPAGQSVQMARIAYFDAFRGTWQLLNTTVVGGNLEAPVIHFSFYKPVLVVPAVGLRQAYAYPNPAVPPAAPRLRAYLGVVDQVEIAIFDQAGDDVHHATLGGTPSGFDNGEYYYEYEWTSAKASGAYFAVIHGKGAKGLVKARASFAVAR
jgi:hypothetical protein